MDLLLQVILILILVSVLEGNFFESLFPGLIKKSKNKNSESEDGECQRPKYRPYDGYCNNLENPTWGTPNTPYKRIFPNNSYGDGLCSIADLPNPRKISLQGFVHLEGTEDPKWTLNTILWGQTVAHDMGLTAGVPQPGDPDIPCNCVDKKIIGESKNDVCAPIIIPEDDPYNVPEGNECMDFIRTESTCDSKPDQPAEQINRINSYLDASLVYGNSEEEAKELRSFTNGKLLDQTRDGRIYPPQSNDECFSYSIFKETLCLKTGDQRSNQNPYIGLSQIMLLRYHNNIAEELCTTINPQWDDETCFQESRRIVIATVQHITFYEFLTFILGKINMIKHNLIPLIPSTFHSVYDEKVDPSTINEHSGAAFRVFHSCVRGFIKLMTQDRQQFGTVRLSDHYDDASLFLQKYTELGLATGFSTQHQWEISDRYHDSEVTQELFRYNDLLGLDLFTFDLFRGREHGLAPYAVALKECGLGDPKSFDDFEQYISKENVELLKKLYDSYDQVEIRVGGQLEEVTTGGLTGPLYNCIMLKQFYATKAGDYYWYENEEQDYPFTEEQLKSIKIAASLSSILCNQVDGMKKIQKLAFEKESFYNPMTDCKDIETIDLTLWKE